MSQSYSSHKLLIVVTLMITLMVFFTIMMNIVFYNEADQNEINRNVLREWQQNRLHLYERMKEFFKELNVTYWANGGTLIGAVRDKGFIVANVGDHDMDFDADISYKDIIMNHTEYAEKKYNLSIRPAFEEVHSIFGTRCFRLSIRKNDWFTIDQYKSKYNPTDEQSNGGIINEYNGGIQIYDKLHKMGNIDIFWRTTAWIPHFYTYIHGSSIYAGVSFENNICEDHVFPIKYIPFQTTVVPVPNKYENVLDNIWGKNKWRVPKETHLGGVYQWLHCMAMYLPDPFNPLNKYKLCME